MDGLIIIYKEKGFTSFDVVAKLRGILRQRKIGHTGTLDPDATGVLPVCLGNATKVVELLTDKEKTYRVKIHFGLKTDTQDISGKVLETRDVSITEEDVICETKKFLGNQMQIPPMYSALKVNGKKLCDLARAGIEVERKARPVCFYRINILSVELPYAEMEITCSKGTYIRTFCEDLGEKLGCGACMEELIRTEVGNFSLADALTLEEVQKLADEGKVEQVVKTVESVFEKYPRACCKKEGDRLLYNGNPLGSILLENPKEKILRMCDSQGKFIGIYQWREEKEAYYPLKMFL